jgi:hypothetical protein
MPQPQPPCLGTHVAVPRPRCDSRRTSRTPVLSVAQACGELLAPLAYGTFHRRLPDSVIVIHSVRFRGRDRGTASWLDQTIAADGLDDVPGCVVRGHTTAARSMVAAERFERGTKPGRLLEQLLQAPFDAADNLFKARRSS